MNAVAARMLLWVSLLARVHHAAPSGPPPVCKDVIESTRPLRGTGTRHALGACKYAVKAFAIVGERNSGINFLSQLIKENIKPGSAEYLHEYPKHWRPSEYAARVPKHTLFMLAIRNPYDWLTSMHGQCYCCEKMMEGSFGDFLAKPYMVDTGKSECPATDGFGPMGNPIQDMMALRSLKLHMHLHLGMARRPYFVLVRLEDLWCRNNTAAWLQEQLADFCFDWKDDIKGNLSNNARNWLGSKFNLQQKFDYSWYFNPKRTCELHSASVRTINTGLHSKLEHRIGYTPLQCP